MSAPGVGSQRLEIDANLDRRGAEALLVEIRLLALELGIEPGETRVETAATAAGEGSA
jgi:hypothetical protein